MRGKKRLLYNTVLLTASSLLMRLIAMAYQVWLASRIGSAGIGLYQLVMSVDFLCATFAISGIRFATVRLLSEELGVGRGASSVTARCLLYSLFFGTAAFLVLFFAAEPVGFLWIGDARTVLSLKVLSFSLPFMAVASVISGYFTAVGRVWKSAVVMVGEQLVRITLVAVFLSYVRSSDLERCCAAVSAGATIAEVVACFAAGALFIHDLRAHSGDFPRSERLTARMFGIALPLAFSAYARTSLSTLEHLLVPRGLRASGISADRALSGYGTIQGMALPVIIFPSCLLTSLADLIVPALTEAQVAGRRHDISQSIRLLLCTSLLFSCAMAVLMWFYAEWLGFSIYGSAEAGRFIKLLAPLLPIIYTDIVTDGCLRGLGQHMWSMSINIFESAIGVLLVWSLIPSWGLTAYLGIIYFNECLNFFLSIKRLMAVTGIRIIPNIKKARRSG